VRHHRDLTAASAVAVLCATISLSIPLEGLRIAAGLPLCLVLPGYAIASAIFARPPMRPAPVLLLGMALSLATLVIGSVLLHAAPWGLRAGTWAGLLVAVTLVGCFVAAHRRRRSRPVLRRQLAIRIRPVDGALLVGAVVVAVAAGAIAWMPFPAKDVAGYTRLWLLPLDEDGAAGVRVGVGSEEQDTTAYELELRFGGKRAPILSEIVLAPGQERVLKVRVEEPPAGTSMPVTARLYQLDSRVPYRRARSWISGT
jgi:uncharacterized membrane protein